MTCSRIVLPDGRIGIICGRRWPKKHRCFYCPAVAEYQCDHPVFRNNKRGTCDTWMCKDCRNDIGKELDLCRPHFNFWRSNGNRFVLGGLAR
jgi:ribosomal protein L37AE/L43A